ncbi:hypothetical protein CGMCC3_g9001 [Colletotrichum fructicola]|uniref:Uncharacterized protein n=1 Tax=Colletotrichum chrysophilum TaxID=1836956 RepID=A0AAD9EH75_9PEZI|nr:uncharacterized protein CGMCC3_g9001 [Colletotrichum fructicola]KAE9575111.1 hypothetical protein CGMCC3_g9001 [Colletotrichum fructicola]KAK1848388.1 hypothetical protein CCHR01_09006 [Colletotrichum chrysophilum]
MNKNTYFDVFVNGSEPGMLDVYLNDTGNVQDRLLNPQPPPPPPPQPSQ